MRIFSVIFFIASSQAFAMDDDDKAYLIERGTGALGLDQEQCVQMVNAVDKIFLGDNEDFFELLEKIGEEGVPQEISDLSLSRAEARCRLDPLAKLSLVGSWGIIEGAMRIYSENHQQ